MFPYKTANLPLTSYLKTSFIYLLLYFPHVKWTYKMKHWSYKNSVLDNAVFINRECQ